MTTSDVRAAAPDTEPAGAEPAPARRRLAAWRPPGFASRVAAITAGGAVLRFAFLGRQPLWRDEAFTVLAVHRSVGAMLRVIAHDSAPPLSYLVQHVLVSVWGGNGGLRALSALAGTAAIPIAAALGRRVGGHRVGLWCAATVAVFPSLVLASRDARLYALATTLVLASTLAVWRLVERPTWARAAVYGAATAAALATNYFTAFAVIGQLAAVLVILRVPAPARTRAVTAAAIAAVPLLPWLVYARAQFAHGASPFWVGGVGFSTVSGVAVQFFAGPSLDAGIPGHTALVVLQAVVVTLGIASLVAMLARWRAQSATAHRGVAFLAGGSLGGMALLVAVSVWHPLVEARYASVMWGPLVCVVGVGLAVLPWRRFAVGSLAVTGAAAVVLSFALTQPDTPSLAQHVNGRVRPGDLVVTSPAAYLLVLHYGDATVRAHTHIVSRDVPWYWGTAVFPKGAVLRRYPSDASGTVFYVDVPGQPSALRPSGSYERDGPRRCYSSICLTVYRPVGISIVAPTAGRGDR